MVIARLALLLLALLLRTAPAAAADVTCVAACGPVVEEAYRECVQSGSENCAAAAQAALAACVAACPQPPTECPALCEAGASEVQSRCLAVCDAGESCASICQQAYDATRDRCVAELCEGGGEVCTADERTCCLADCAGVARGVFVDCMQANGDAAAAMCEGQAKDALELCAADRCGVVPPQSCEDRCSAIAVAAVERCVAAGEVDPAECEAIGARLRQDCLDEHCTEAGPGCEERCRDGAEDGFHACILNQGSEVDCAAAAQAQGVACVADQCATPEPDCPTRCGSAIGALVDACNASGEFDPTFCHAKGAEALRHCIDEHCVDSPAPEPTCGERCADHAKVDVRRCIEEGMPEVDCLAAGQEEFRTCVSLHCDPSEACTARCDRRAERARMRCAGSGGSEEVCAAAAEAMRARCMSGRCIPTPPDTCESNCDTTAAGAEEACLAEPEADAGACSAVKAAALDACASVCGVAADATCSEDCESVAQERHDVVLAHTGDEDRATRKARRTYRRCMLVSCGG